jgi:hypothetical protein
MTATHSHRAHRRLDVASLALLLVGVVSGVFSYWLITYQAMNALIIIPSIVTITIGATHITKREASRP